MEITYRVSEAEYISASKIRRKMLRKTGKPVLFWIFILVCLMLLWGVIQRIHRQTGVDAQDSAIASSDTYSAEPVTQPSPASLSRNTLVNVAPWIFVAGVWLFLVLRALPTQLCRLYRKDPVMQGQFTINVTPNSLTIQNTAGLSSQVTWNLYECWREGKNLIVLAMHSSAYFVISLAQLSEPQRNELRGILVAALPHEAQR